jgi:hypothetical protein
MKNIKTILILLFSLASIECSSRYSLKEISDHISIYRYEPASVNDIAGEYKLSDGYTGISLKLNEDCSFVYSLKSDCVFVGDTINNNDIYGRYSILKDTLYLEFKNAVQKQKYYSPSLFLQTKQGIYLLTPQDIDFIKSGTLKLRDIPPVNRDKYSRWILLFKEFK